MKRKISLILLTLMIATFAGSFAVSANGVIATGTVTGDVVNIRAGQGTNTAILTQVRQGTVLDVFAVYDEWVYVWANGRMGYIFKQYLQVNYIQNGQQGQVSEKGQSVCDFAAKYLGLPYRYGGNTPETGFDCSGFTKYVYSNFGVSLNRVAADQAQNGYYVDKNDLQPGDLVFFGYYGSKSIGHVGIYVGDGNFIHSPSSGKSIMYSSLNSYYYLQNYITARRVL